MAIADLFEADAANWDAYYERRDVFSVIHQLRRTIALEWVDELSLPPGAAVLEVGCGTGLLAIALAQRDLQVTAVDSVAAMLARAEANIRNAGLEGRISLSRADSQRLPVRSTSFQLVVALGLIPWVPSPAGTLADMARTLIPGGRLIVNCDNHHRLPVMIDPRYTPALGGIRTAVTGRRRTQTPPGGDATVRHSRREFDALLTASGLRVEKGTTFGFGPFTFMGRRALPEAAGVGVHRLLQRLADANVPGIRSTGAQYLVRAVRRQAR